MTTPTRQPCRACDRADLIKAALAQPGATMRGVAKAFGVPKSTMERHLKGHVPKEPEKPSTARERARQAADALAAATAGPTRHEVTRLAVKALAAAPPSASAALEGPPPAACPICASADHYAIGGALQRGATYAALATRYGVNVEPLRRHALGCIPDLLAQAGDLAARMAASALILERSPGTVGDTEALLEQAQQLVKDSAANEDPRKRAAAILAAKVVIELLAKLRGELGADVEGNLATAPAWIKAKTLIINALAPHPEALEAVREALAAAEGA